MASGTTKLTLSTQDYVKVKTVGGEVLQGRVHALCESTSTLVIRLAGAGTTGGKEGEREGVREGMTGDHRDEAQSPQGGGKGGKNPPALLTRANSSPRHSVRTLWTAVATSEAWVTSRERGTRMPAQGEGKVGSARRAGVRRWGSRRCVGRVREGGWPSLAEEGRNKRQSRELERLTVRCGLWRPLGYLLTARG